MTNAATVTDPHAPDGERDVTLIAPEKSIMTVLVNLREDEARTARERLAAVVESRRDEQASEDAVNGAVQTDDEAVRTEAREQIEAAIDDAVDLARVLEGRFRRSPLDTRRRRAILAILAGQEAA